MAYELTWHLAGKVLQLNLQNGLSFEEMQRANQQALEILNGVDQKLILLIDVSDLVAGYHTVDHLRNTQAYRDHPNLDTIVVIADSKLNRLVTMLAFHLSRARFVQFDGSDKAHTYVMRRSEQQRGASNIH